jgi:hypothetical protein
MRKLTRQDTARIERLRGGNYSIQKINRLVDSAFDKLMGFIEDRDAKGEDIIWTAWWLG